jgi:signal transduction histidine kinase
LNSSAVNQGFDLKSLDVDIGPNGSAFGTALRMSDLAIGLAAFAGAFAAATIVTAGGVASDTTAFAAVLVANIATYTLGGLVWRHGRPSSAFGDLLLVQALLVVVSAFTGSPVAALHLFGIVGGWAAALGLTYLLLAFPGVRLRGGAELVMSIAVSTFLLGQLPLLLLSNSVQGLPALGRCSTNCPANAALIVDAPGAAHVFRNIEAVLQAGWAMGLLVYLVAHFARASHPRRRLLAPVLAASAPFAVMFAVNALAFDLTGLQPHLAARAIFAGTRILAPLGFIAALLFARAYAGEALAFMARSLVGRPSVAAVEQLVRRVLDDPQARLVFWLPGLQRFVDRHGSRVDLEPEWEGLTWRSYGQGDTGVFAIVHDIVLSEDPELVMAVGAATLLSFENRRLQQDLVDSVAELRASQRRLVRAASAERRKIERDLHDGVQQKLVALRIQLGLAVGRADGDSALAGTLAGFGVDFDDALDELRSVAHGIYPPLLADEGLDAALMEVARRSNVPLVIDLADVGRLPEDHETAVYYCCLEALQNVTKHAGDDAAVTLRLWRDRTAVRFTVRDDGAGFVPQQTPRGAGLTNMTDRIGAVGGTLVVRSEPGVGTTVEGRVLIETTDRRGRDVVHA